MNFPKVGFSIILDFVLLILNRYRSSSFVCFPSRKHTRSLRSLNRLGSIDRTRSCEHSEPGSTIPSILVRSDKNRWIRPVRSSPSNFFYVRSFQINGETTTKGVFVKKKKKKTCRVTTTYWSPSYLVFNAIYSVRIDLFEKGYEVLKF